MPGIRRVPSITVGLTDGQGKCKKSIKKMCYVSVALRQGQKAGVSSGWGTIVKKKVQGLLSMYSNKKYL